ncbi:unnamed protein product [Prunus armeniaca]|uniref:Uncharacterized protein n=1 Tax=Prunus armeniaca TaxID=36596 RepID=A0A6J5TS81_PRUAR|nr:unnamed protein product [Prunus armeniaca]CAB4293852.1 unnamed protein product [Prunus armeniaca]
MRPGLVRLGLRGLARLERPTVSNDGGGCSCFPSKLGSSSGVENLNRDWRNSRPEVLKGGAAEDCG